MKKLIEFNNNILIMLFFFFLMIMGLAQNYTNKEIKSINKPDKKYIGYTTARITEINYEDNYDDGYTIEVYAEVVIEDQELIKKINTVRSDLQVGDVIKVYYDKRNPDNISDGSFAKIIDNTIGFLDDSLLLCIVGIIGILINSYCIYKKIVIQKLYDSGELIQAKIVDVIKDSYLGAYKIYCTWINPNDKTKYTFKSKMLAFDPNPYLNKMNEKTIDVYVKKENPKIYVVDVRKVRDEN